MRPASTTVLDLWEAGLPRTPAARAVLLLEAVDGADAAGWPVGRGQLALLTAWSDPARGCEALADCPGCGTVLEVTVDPGTLSGDPAAEVTVGAGTHVVTARPPTLSDLAALDPADAPDALRRQLLSRCVLTASADGCPVTAEELPDDVADRVETALDEADPAADLRLALACPDCGTTWSQHLDPLAFAWSAVEAAATRLAGEVHALARAYGWSEADVLALSPFRRHLYLSAVQP